jgi:uncharacterized membrane protein YhaH (DUF805 family)
MFHDLFSFTGRISRAKMWVLYLLLSAALVPAVALEAYLDDVEGLGAETRWPVTPTGAALRIVIIVWIAIWLFAMFAAIVKRLHDRGKSAAWLALFFGIPTAFVMTSFVYVEGWTFLSPFSGIHVAMLLFFWITLANNFWYLLELLALAGTKGANRFGADPLAEKT